MDIKEEEFLSALLMEYEFGSRTSRSQHSTVPDYHSSGSWGAVTAAAARARLMRLTPQETLHALGIAEYHGSLSQMMRCFAHPTMLKDGSGWGAMKGTMAAKLSQRGSTGAPAITVEAADKYWADLGRRWYVGEQYYEPYPPLPSGAGLYRRSTQCDAAAWLLCKENTKDRGRYISRSC